MDKERFDPKDPLIQKNLPKVKKLLFDDDNIRVYFVPSPWLRQVVATGENPLVQGLVEWIKLEFLQGNGIVVQKRLLWDLINDDLDEKNTFIFSNGDFRVAWENVDPVSTGISWEDKSIKNDILK